MQMKHAIAAAVLAIITNPAHAEERPVASRMTCASVAGMVQSQGEVVFTTGQFGFDRVVRENRFCSSDEITSPAYERTSDQPSCFAGYRCRTWDHGESKG